MHCSPARVLLVAIGAIAVVRAVRSTNKVNDDANANDDAAAENTIDFSGRRGNNHLSLVSDSL